MTRAGLGVPAIHLDDCLREIPVISRHLDHVLSGQNVSNSEATIRRTRTRLDNAG